MVGGRWLNAAAVVTWLVCGLLPIARIASGQAIGWPAWVFVAAFLLFGAALVTCLYRQRGLPVFGSVPSLLLIFVESVTGLAMTYVTGTYWGGTGVSSATLVIVAAQLPYFIRPRLVWSWICLQTLVMMTSLVGQFGATEILSFSVAIGGFQLFAAASSFLARSEASARQNLAATNTELHATRALLAETSRVEERLRISRDLHDTLGHHLTALSLQLDVASRLTDGKAAEHVTQAHAITRLLLGDVRAVVSRLRDSSRFDLTQAIRTLAEDSGDLAIHLDIPAAIDIDDDARAHALVRCVQEIVTNTVRHARARNLWIALTPGADGVALHARDDGLGTATLTFGHGLTGMRERFEEHAGRVEFATASGQGFEVRGFMPRSDTV